MQGFANDLRLLSCLQFRCHTFSQCASGACNGNSNNSDSRLTVINSWADRHPGARAISRVWGWCHTREMSLRLSKEKKVSDSFQQSPTHADDPVSSTISNTGSS